MPSIASGAAVAATWEGTGAAPEVASIDARGSEEEALLASLQTLRLGLDSLFSQLAQRIAEIGDRAREVNSLRTSSESAKEAWELGRRAQYEELEGERARIRAERKAFEEEKERMAVVGARQGDILTLNVGGERVVQRRRSTLCTVQDSFLAARFSGRWEEIDRDDEGRHFVNYSPELFLPLLDYLSARETQDPAFPVPLPQGPEHARPQFEEMLRFFGIVPGALTLDALSVPYLEATSHDYGFAFEVVAKAQAVSLRALETCAAGAASELGTPATIYACPGTLARRLSQTQHDAWVQAGTGPLWPGLPSRIELSKAVLVPANATCCIYIATEGPSGIAFGGDGEARQGETSTENEDLRVLTGKTSGSMKHFAGFGGFISWFHFNGKLEYTLPT
mmetsp:Transcript_41668/g.90857  ORF Transcript_41668/g.90857 Transcript_41668/m.90857 type:complete len:394 (-) Transcript_41668:87-1268(-)